MFSDEDPVVGLGEGEVDEERSALAQDAGPPSRRVGRGVVCLAEGEVLLKPVAQDAETVDCRPSGARLAEGVGSNDLPLDDSSTTKLESLDDPASFTSSFKNSFCTSVDSSSC